MRVGFISRAQRTTLAVLLISSASLLIVSTGAEAATPKASVQCPTSTPGSTTLSPSIGGFKRTVIVHLPKSSTDASPLPLVLNLHGSGSTALGQEEFSGMNKTANQNDFIVAYPQALIPDGTGYDWNVPNVPLLGGRSVPKGAANDITFLTKLVGVLESDYCVDRNDIFVTGMSGGAREASQLACDDSTLFAAVAPVSGLRRPLPCPATRAVPIIAFHGSADPVDPFAGHGEPYWTYSVPTAAKDWSKQDKCTAKPVTSTPEANVKLTTYAKCANGADVELYEVMGEGHEWPGGPVMPATITDLLGPQSTAISANNVMWAFFKAHALS